MALGALVTRDPKPGGPRVENELVRVLLGAQLQCAIVLRILVVSNLVVEVV